MNIVLDMDNTLIEGCPYTYDIIPRPNLEIFLVWCFQNFKNVSIWTAANRLWFNRVNELVFKDILLKINKSFDFVFTSDKCTTIYEFSEWHGQCFPKTIKKLRKLHKYRSEKFKDYDIENTIIVDDKSKTFSQNYGNGICVEPFEPFTTKKEVWSNDVELLRLCIFLCDVVIPNYNTHGTVRNLEKRYWRQYVIEVEKMNGF